MNSIDYVQASLHYSLLYFATIALSGLFSAFGKASRTKKRRFIFFISTVLFILMAFRDIEMGNDTRNYVEMFNVTGYTPLNITV